MQKSRFYKIINFNGYEVMENSEKFGAEVILRPKSSGFKISRF